MVELVRFIICFLTPELEKSVCGVQRHLRNHELEILHLHKAEIVSAALNGQ